MSYRVLIPQHSTLQVMCSVIAGFLHYFFLATFTWMFLEGLHIIFMLVQVFDASNSRLPYYYLTGYGKNSMVFLVFATISLFPIGGVSKVLSELFPTPCLHVRTTMQNECLQFNLSNITYSGAQPGRQNGAYQQSLFERIFLCRRPWNIQMLPANHVYVIAMHRRYICPCICCYLLVVTTVISLLCFRCPSGDCGRVLSV